MKLTISILFLLFNYFNIINNVQSAPSNKIINGMDANAEWVCYIVSKQEGLSEHGFLFSGALITRKHVITVAQAIQSYFRWTVGYGSAAVDNLIFMNSFDAIIHDKYNPANLNNNIGIIRLPELVPETITLGTYLPEPDSELPFMATVFGYGYTSEATSTLATTLQFGAVTPITNDECSLVFGNQLITSGTMCANVSFMSARICHGDQGGPLIAADTSRLLGISSFWYSSCDDQSPMVFVRVSSYLDWINNIINEV